MKRTLSRRTILKSGAGIALSLSAPALLGRRALANDAPKLQTVNPGVITMATVGDMPMVAVRDGQVVGTDADMLRLIASRLGLELRADVMEWSACLASVPGGRADWVGGNTAWTAQRSQAMLMTDEVYYTGMYALMKKDRPFETSIAMTDFAGKSVGALTGTAPVPDLRKYSEISEVKLYDTTDACVRDVAAGRADFAILDAPFVDYIIQQDASLDLKQVPMKFDPEYRAATGKQYSVWGMNSENTDLYDAVNQGVKWLWKTGQIGPILKKYGITSDDYLKPAEKSPRLGVDRDEAGNLIGRFKHEPKDFSAYFS